MSLSKPIPTPDDAVMRSEDVLLLKCAYLDGASYDALPLFFRVIRATYGNAISSYSLRHSMLAWCAVYLPPERFGERAEYHKSQARLSLSKKLANPSLIDDGDVFASCILAEIAWKSDTWSEESIHLNGCLSMFQHLSDDLTGNNVSRLLKIFGPYVLNRLNLYAAVNSGGEDAVSHHKFPRRRTTFMQRVNYRHALRQVDFHSQSVCQTDIIEGIHDTLGDLVWTIIYCWARRLDMEIAKDFGPDPIVRDVLQYVAAELDDPEFQRAVATLRLSHMSGRMKGEPLEVQLVTYQFLQLEFIELARTVLKAPVMAEARVMSRAASTAQSLISFFRTEFPRQGVLRDYYCHAYTETLLLSAWLLPFDELSRRKSSNN